MPTVVGETQTASKNFLFPPQAQKERVGVVEGGGGAQGEAQRQQEVGDGRGGPQVVENPEDGRQRISEDVALSSQTSPPAFA